MIKYPAAIFKDLHDYAPGIISWRWIGTDILQVEFAGGGLMEMGRQDPGGSVMIDAVGIVEETCRDLQAGWPRCPRHTTHVLHLDSTEQQAIWRCPTDSQIAMEVGNLRNSGATLQAANLVPNTVRWWRDGEGYGIVATERGDAWLTFDAIQLSGGSPYRSVREGQVLSFVEVEEARPGRLLRVIAAIP